MPAKKRRAQTTNLTRVPKATELVATRHDTTRHSVIFKMTNVNQNDTLFFQDGLAEMAFMMEMGHGKGND